MKDFRVCGLPADWTSVFIAKDLPTPRLISARSETWNLIMGLIRTTGVFKDSHFFCYCCCYCKCYLCMSLSAHPPAHCESYRRRHDSFFFSFFFSLSLSRGWKDNHIEFLFFIQCIILLLEQKICGHMRELPRNQVVCWRRGKARKWDFGHFHNRILHIHTNECSMHFILHTGHIW